MATYVLNFCHSHLAMDVDPKVTTGSELGSKRTPELGQPDLTESSPPILLKGRYLLGPELGRGGFAITYLATDQEVASRTVVVKVLNEYRSRDAWALNKFRTEMEALARIDHPNVVSVFDFGYREDGKPFLVMQYVPGRKLREMIPRNGLPLAQAAALTKQIGRALSAAHDVGVCHRDLKPENIIVQTDGEREEHVKLIDFGIASIRTPGEDASTGISGTYSYMSPEQYHGKCSPESDVYQMGIIAYELVTGITPFRAPTPAGILMQEMEGVHVLPRDLRPDLPEPAERAILKALAPQPQDRYERARDFGDALASALISQDWSPAQSTKSSAHRAKILAAKRQRSRWILAGAFSMSVLALAVTAYFVLRTRLVTADSVAVLPFQNRTGDPALAYLAEGITDSLINDLSRIPTLRVSARGSVVKYDSSRVDVSTAGRELGVTRVVDGFISKQGDSLYLDTELIDVRSGTRLWGNAYTGKMSSLADMLEQFSIEVTDQLRLKLSGSLKDRLKRQYATKSDAYQKYLKARFYLNKRTATGLQEAIRYFNEAMDADADYAPAHAGLGYTYAVMFFNGPNQAGADPLYALEKARKAAEQALQLDGTLAEAYNTRAFVEMEANYNWEAAEKDFQRSISLNPNWADTHEIYAIELTALGRFDDALREINKAEHLEPSFIPFQVAHGLVLYMARRNDESLRVLKALRNNAVYATILGPSIAVNYWVKSMPTEALAAIEEIPMSEADVRIPLLAAGYARMGQVSKAKELLTTYSAPAGMTQWYYLALAHLSLQQRDNAMRDLEDACEQHAQAILFLGVDPMLDELRAESRFHALLDRINLNRKDSQQSKPI